MNKILPFLSDFVPEDLAQKGLSKINPKLKEYFSNAAKSGIGGAAALSFLKSRFKQPAEQAENERLKKGVKSQTLRPDEKVSAQDRGRDEGRSNMLKGAATGVAALAGGAGGAVGGALLSGIGGPAQDETQLTPRQPQQPSPLSGQAIAEDVEAQQMQGQEQQQQQIGQDDFPQLLQFIQKKMSEGASLPQAAQAAMQSPYYQGLARKIEQQEGISFLDWVAKSLGMEGSGQPGQQQQGGGGNRDQIMQMGAQIAQTLAGLRR